MVCDLQKSGLQIIIASQQNVLRNLFTKSNDEVLTTSCICTYLFLRLKLFLHMWTPIFLTIPPVKKYVTPGKCNIFFNFQYFFQQNNLVKVWNRFRPKVVQKWFKFKFATSKNDSPPQISSLICICSWF